MSLNIGIDISQIIYETGVSWYTQKLVKNLLKVDNQEKYILFGGSLRRRNDLRSIIKDFSGNFKSRIYPIPPTLADLIWNKTHILPIDIFTGKLDIFHSSDWTQPPTKAFKVTTIHDLSPIKYPEYLDSKIVAVHLRRLEWVKKECDRIIVPSQAVKYDLLENGYSENKIRVIPEAATYQIEALEENIIKIKTKYGLKRDYFLSVGVNKRKNTDRIIKAYKSGFSEDFDLVLVGEPRIDIERNENIKVLGHVAASDLQSLYSGAKMLLYPSLDEGFGLPLLDAFICKCPVVTSNIPSLLEVAGKAAVLVDPFKVEAIIEGITNALANRQKLVAKGLKRAKEFSWGKVARQTLKVYKEVI